MDSNSADYQDTLSSLERQLAGWRPDSQGLHTDQMLYAAGVATGKSGQRQAAWAMLCVVLTLVSAISISWGLLERSEKRALAIRVQQHDAELSHSATLALAGSASSMYTPTANDYFHLRQRAEKNPGEWLASSQHNGREHSDMLPLNLHILKAGQHDRYGDQ
jgi:hypothetical protein